MPPRPRLTCKEFIDFLDNYVDGTLAAERRARFDAHLVACPQCVDFLRTYRETIRLARGGHHDETIPAEVPEELIQAVLRARSGITNRLVQPRCPANQNGPCE